MKFRIKNKQFVNDGAVYTATVVARKLNGYKVINPEGNVTFICLDDIDVLELSEAEKKMQVEF